MMGKDGRDIERELGELVLRTLPEGSAFIVLHWNGDRPNHEARIVSNFEPKLIAAMMMRQAMLLSRGEFSETGPAYELGPKH
jgi:hypothetical protein